MMVGSRCIGYRTIRLWGLGLVAAQLWAQPGRALPSEGPDLVDEARALRAAGKDREAIATLKKAEVLDPASVRVQVHLSNAYQAVGEWLLAEHYLRLALSHLEHPYVQRHQRALYEARSVIHANLGTLEVNGEPAGAEVWLNGRRVGTLPLKEPLRAIVGSYSLEVRLEGYYTTRRPIVIEADAVVRESVRLEHLRTAEPDLGVPSDPVVGSMVAATSDRQERQPWLAWTFAGLGVVAGLTSVGAVIYRDVHAQRYNDDSRCLRGDRTRDEVCGFERENVRAGERVAIATGVAAGVFAAAALLDVLVFARPPATEAGFVGCSVGVQGANCFAHF